MNMANAGELKGIARDTLRFILEASRSSHPLEFIGLLRPIDGVIAEVLLIPGSEASNQSATLRFDMVPLTSGSVGTVHSHPSPYPNPSREDLFFFSRHGRYHIIAAYPYTEDSWRCYDAAGRELTLEVLDVELPDDDLWDEEFDLWTEEDIQ